MILLLMALQAHCEVPCKAELCRDGPYQVTKCTVTSNPPVRNANDTIHFTGMAAQSLSIANVKMEVKLNGVHLDTETLTYSQSYDSGDKTVFEYIRFIPSFAPAGNYYLEFNFMSAEAENLGCWRYSFKL